MEAASATSSRTSSGVPSTSGASSGTMTTVSRVGGMETRWWRDATSGAAAGMVSVLALHPLDVIKTRLQVQDGVDRRAAAYRGTVHAFRTVARQEGARGFYAGVVPAVVGSTVSWGVYFTCYNNAKARYRRARDLEHLPSHLHLASAAEAGLVVSLATNPIWVVKTRLQLQKKISQSDAANAGGPRGGTAVRPYRGFVDALAQIARNEGIAGLYKGLGPSVFLVSHGALQFAAYERLRAWRTKRETTFTTTTEQNGPATVPPSAFECAWLGVASKLFASTVTYPSQVVRARMQQRERSVGVRLDGKQNAGSGSAPNAPLYRGFFSSLRDIIRREGASGLYKGMVPNVLRTLPSSGVTFMVYESVRSFLGEDDEARRR